MAELPGWDRGRLATADPRDVEAARLLVYARARAPEIRADLDGQIGSLQLAALDGEAHRIAAARQRDEDLRKLREAKGHQTGLREVLELDALDEPDEEFG